MLYWHFTIQNSVWDLIPTNSFITPLGRSCILLAYDKDSTPVKHLTYLLILILLTRLQYVNCGHRTGMVIVEVS